MLIPDKSETVWQQLVTGQKEYRFKLVPASMMLSRLIRSVQIDNSPANIERCVDELYNFFTHYQVVLNKDIQQLFDATPTPESSTVMPNTVSGSSTASLVHQRAALAMPMR